MSTKKDSGMPFQLDEKTLLEVLQYAYQKGEKALSYTAKELIEEMMGKIQAAQNLKNEG